MNLDDVPYVQHTPWWEKPYEYTYSNYMWEPGRDWSTDPPNWRIEGGYMDRIYDGWDEPPFYEPAPVECITVRPIMKCWGRGLDHVRT